MIVYDYILESLDYDIKGFNKEDICFLDIETTGLSRKYNMIYLIGLVYYRSIDGSWSLVQYFAQSKDDEENILREFNEFIKRFKVIITYNGESFDLPFIESRLNKYNLKNNLNSLNSFDIYRKVKQESPYLNLDNLKLKTVEKSLGIYRDDKYTGKDCIDFYYEYLDTKDEKSLDRILKHNYEDLYYLVPVMNIFDVMEDSKSIYIRKNNREIKIIIKDISVKGHMFQVCCESNIKDKNSVYYTDNYNLQWIDNKIDIKIECRKGMITPTKKCIYVDVSKWKFRKNLRDLSQYMTPNNLMLLKVEHKFVMDNIKLILKEMILFII